MARRLKRTGGARGTSSAPSRRTRRLALAVGLLFGLASAGCANLDAREVASRIDLVILATDQETEHELLQRLRNVENLAALRAGKSAWSRGHLIGARDGSLYTILVGQIGGRDEATTEMITRRAAEIWRPRYVLLLGTTLAIANEVPLGAVGLTTLTCDFELDRFEKFRDTGRCYRPDGGLLTAALAVADEWKTTAKAETGRAGCSPPQVTKLAALSGQGSPGPKFVEVATKISQELHRGLIVEREGVFAAKAVETLRHEMREPIGFLMIRGVSETRSPRRLREADRKARGSKQRQLEKTCAARDTADFAVELIRRRWPVASRTKR